MPDLRIMVEPFGGVDVTGSCTDPPSHRFQVATKSWRIIVE